MLHVGLTFLCQDISSPRQLVLSSHHILPLIISPTNYLLWQELGDRPAPKLTAFDLGCAHHLPLPVKISRGSWHHLLQAQQEQCCTTGFSCAHREQIFFFKSWEFLHPVLSLKSYLEKNYCVVQHLPHDRESPADSAGFLTSPSGRTWFKLRDEEHFSFLRCPVSPLLTAELGKNQCGRRRRKDVHQKPKSTTDHELILLEVINPNISLRSHTFESGRKAPSSMLY